MSDDARQMSMFSSRQLFKAIQAAAAQAWVLSLQSDWSCGGVRARSLGEESLLGVEGSE